MFANSPEIAILRSPERIRRSLIFLRAGSQERPSLFRDPPPADRNFDIAVNYFASPHDDDALREAADYVIGGGLSKFHAAKQFLHRIGVHRYDAVWFLDDDVELHFDPAEFLDYCESRNFAIAQPALTHASDGAWRITYVHPGFEYRLTNFVEIMAPCLARDFLMTVVESFDLSISTYGLDVFWGSQMEDGQRAAIVDIFQMSHRRPRDFADGAFYAYLRSMGIDPFGEMKKVLDLLGLSTYQIRFLGGAPIVEEVRIA